MSLRANSLALDASSSELGTPALRRFDWELQPVAALRLRPPGPRAIARQPAPAGFNSGYRHHFGMNPFRSLRPTAKSAANWSRTDIVHDLGCGSRLFFDWIAGGFTAIQFLGCPEPFEFGAGKPIAVQGSKAGLRSVRSSPNRCLAGLQLRACSTEN